MEGLVTFPLFLLAAALTHGPWTSLLQRYVTPQARVDYARLSAEALPALDGYLGQLAQPWPAGMTPIERKAALINAYNALTVRWVAGHYPVSSIWRTVHPFTAARHRVNGRVVSLDQIETELRDMGDPRVHAVLVCAARSCPPLRREAYEAEKLDAQLDDNTRAWLANPMLHGFDASRGEVEVSEIFDWYRGDFEKGGGTVGAFLARYGPPWAAGFARTARIRYRPYYWGLNDTGAAGDSYWKATFYWDYYRDKYF